jgi:hypothetical protein
MLTWVRTWMGDSVEKMHPMPVVIAGPSLGIPGSKERMMAMLFEEFADVFGQVTVYTTVAPGAFGCGTVVRSHLTSQ